MSAAARWRVTQVDRRAALPVQESLDLPEAADDHWNLSGYEDSDGERHRLKAHIKTGQGLQLSRSIRRCVICSATAGSVRE
jgi:hypothetical protein